MSPPIYKNENTDKVFMYKERGIYEICRYSNQPIADDFNDWVYDTILSIKRMVITSLPRKTKWLGTRQETKEVRKAETDQIKLFVEYAKGTGEPARRSVLCVTDQAHKPQIRHRERQEGQRQTRGR